MMAHAQVVYALKKSEVTVTSLSLTLVYTITPRKLALLYIEHS
jgi:hypothetical protein